ncbi:S41 family peptidase [Stenotrophomonas sp. NPDC047960]|uniref:S41 family peptidase n=1 Tax=Stenotrophomonas sp. NPDC047960 TaxID=3364531 RepID=UPI003710D101
MRESILQLLEQRALYRDKIDWPAARQQIQQASGTAEADKILDQLIASSTGNHGRWIRESQVSSPSGGMKRIARAEEGQRPHGREATSGQGPVRTDEADPIGWISISAFKESSTASPAVRDQQRLAFARQLQSQLRKEDERDRCGWIVDLRQNQGGNMWPMLVGIAPLLSTDPKHREVIGAFVGGPERQIWSIDSGLVLLDERAPVALDSPAYSLRHPAPPVAVLIGPKTASSGEAVALAFRGRPATRSFGQRSAGYSTANVPTRLPDGSILLLTGSVSVDRNLKGDGGKLQPDVTVSNAADAEQTARNWLRAQSQCHAVASNR